MPFAVFTEEPQTRLKLSQIANQISCSPFSLFVSSFLMSRLLFQKFFMIFQSLANFYGLFHADISHISCKSIVLFNHQQIFIYFLLKILSDRFSFERTVFALSFSVSRFFPCITVTSMLYFFRVVNLCLFWFH